MGLRYIKTSDNDNIQVDSAYRDAQGSIIHKTYQREIKSGNLLDSDLVTDTNNNNKFVTQAMYNWLAQQTYNTPNIAELVLLDNNDQAVSTTIEIGSSVTVYKIRHRETNISNIDGNLLFNNQTITPSATSAIVELTTPITITTTTTKSLTGYDTNNNPISRSATVSVNTYIYTTHSSSSTAPTTGLTKTSVVVSSNSGFNIAYNADDYVYAYHTASNKTLQYYVLGEWYNVQNVVVSESAISITLNNGTSANYYAYKVGPFISGATTQFRFN